MADWLSVVAIFGIPLSIVLAFYLLAMRGHRHYLPVAFEPGELVIRQAWGTLYAGNQGWFNSVRVWLTDRRICISPTKSNWGDLGEPISIWFQGLTISREKLKPLDFGPLLPMRLEDGGSRLFLQVFRSSAGLPWTIETGRWFRLISEVLPEPAAEQI